MFNHNTPIHHYTLLICLLLTIGCVENILPPTPTPIRTDPGPDECQNRVLVIVWGDLNGDGIQDPDEPPLADVLLRMTPQDDLEAEGIQLTTGENGRANFPTRELEDCRPAGYQLLFLRQVPGYAFPADPVIDLDDFDPINDAVYFGLQVE
ncbi:MAG: hypothetical protein QNJ45_26105 [Ardenticatenaceae bacterium]|nr:hypothetical protein [Ardenticatenaceae bacterium]